MLISFLYVPLLLNSLDSDDYAIWLTLTSIISMLGLFDIGLGNGLRNRLAAAIANNDINKGRQLVSTAYVCIVGLILLLLFIFLTVNIFIDWNVILNAHKQNERELNELVIIVFSSFFAQFALSLLGSVLFAIQKPAISSFLSFISHLISLMIVAVLSKHFRVNSLLILGSAISLVTPVVLFISSVVLFTGKFKGISPRISYFNKQLIPEILSLGVIFFLLQIITLLLFQSNNLIIAHVVGNEAVIEYNIVYKYMYSLVIIFNMIATPLWSATTEAYEKKDYNWIINTNYALLKIALIMSLIGVVMLIFAQPVYTLWLHNPNVTINNSTNILLLLNSIAMMFYGSYGYLLNGVGKMRIQLICTTILSLSYIPLSIFLGNRFGLTGILFLFTLNTTLNIIWSRIQFKKLIIYKTAAGIWNK